MAADTTENALLVIYSGVLIASFFMVLSLGRLAICEARETHGKRLRHNTYFIITAALVMQSVALIGVASYRVLDGLSGRDIGGHWPAGLMFFMTLLWLAKICFHWAATIGRPRWQWRVFVGVTILDIVFLVLWVSV